MGSFRHRFNRDHRSPPDPQILSIDGLDPVSPFFGTERGATGGGQLFAIANSTVCSVILFTFFSLSDLTGLAGIFAPDFWAGESNRKGSTLFSQSPLASLVHPLYHYSTEFPGRRSVFSSSFFFFHSLSSIFDHIPRLSHSFNLSTLHFYSVVFEVTLLIPIPTIPSSSLSPLPTSPLLLPKSVCSTSERLTRVILLFSAYTSQDA